MVTIAIKGTSYFKMFKHAILLIIFFYCDLQASHILDVLENIPVEHQQNIRYLFHHIFLQQDGVYTIFGDKPVSSAGSFLIPKWEATLIGYPGKLGKAWESWQKYKHKFPISKFVIIGEKYPSKKSGTVAIYIYIINKEKFIETINNHLSLFENILKNKINPEKFLDEIATEKISLLKSIHHKEMLFGLLLGYGRHNAYLYERSKQSRHARILFPQKLTLSCCGEEYHPMMIVNPLTFKGDLDNPETEILCKKYKGLHKKISYIYSKGDLLELTLSQLTKGGV